MAPARAATDCNDFSMLGLALRFMWACKRRKGNHECCYLLGAQDDLEHDEGTCSLQA